MTQTLKQLLLISWRRIWPSKSMQSCRGGSRFLRRLTPIILTGRYLLNRMEKSGSTLSWRPKADYLPMTCVTRRVQRLSAARPISRHSVLAKPLQGMLWPGRWMMCWKGLNASRTVTIVIAPKVVGQPCYKRNNLS